MVALLAGLEQQQPRLSCDSFAAARRRRLRCIIGVMGGAEVTQGWRVVRLASSSEGSDSLNIVARVNKRLACAARRRW